MGLSYITSTFFRLIQTILSDQKQFYSAYFDDLFVFTKADSVDDHPLYWTRYSLDILCLGGYIGLQGIRIDPDKIRLIREWSYHGRREGFHLS
ncbi:hypothetical protein PHMEG_0006479 [Phytophthora megakarya]|uniref:Reverse transcriptase domain-containing protein n=1 Tax=Phytophthora megakarya TaxID=4795 RepID=A0A225WNV8_9STRA|nr:hypothetical protein PHMEG_0006479 [Phytophthora megakarya]